MKLKVERFQKSDDSTIGKLYLGDDLFCYTLEDLEREEKIYGQTAIPKGSYKVVIDLSQRFKTELPRLLDVPGFEGVRIHPGNKAEDTDGCILVGDKWGGGNSIFESRGAFNRLMEKLRAAQGEITLDIV